MNDKSSEITIGAAIGKNLQFFIAFAIFTAIGLGILVSDVFSNAAFGWVTFFMWLGGMSLLTVLAVPDINRD